MMAVWLFLQFHAHIKLLHKVLAHQKDQNKSKTSNTSLLLLSEWMVGEISKQSFSYVDHWFFINHVRSESSSLLSDPLEYSPHQADFCRVFVCRVSRKSSPELVEIRYTFLQALWQTWWAPKIRQLDYNAARFHLEAAPKSHHLVACDENDSILPPWHN